MYDPQRQSFYPPSFLGRSKGDVKAQLGGGGTTQNPLPCSLIQLQLGSLDQY
jgi:hypothetical protein